MTARTTTGKSPARRGGGAAAAREFHALLRQLNFRIIARCNTALARGAVTAPQYGALSTAADHGPLPMGKLARRLHVSVGAATHLVDRLVRKRLVRRGRDRNDRRVVLVDATPRGRQEVRTLQGKAARVLRPHIDRLTARERKSLNRLFRKLVGEGS